MNKAYLSSKIFHLRPCREVGATYMVALILLLVLTLGSFSTALYQSHHRRLDNREGLILIDPPEIYTRERLVNDRFTHQAWLREMLDLTRDPVSVKRRDGVLSQKDMFVQIDASNSVRSGDGDNSSRTDRSAGSEASESLIKETDGVLPAAAPKWSMPMGLSQADSFRIHSAYRSEIRHSLLETMLDDAHDFDGNSLYMLKFDVAVIPPESTKKVAAVVVELVHPTLEAKCYNENQNKPCHINYEFIDRNKKLIDRIYDEWVYHVGESVNKKLVSHYNNFWNLGSSESDLRRMLAKVDGDITASTAPIPGTLPNPPTPSLVGAIDSTSLVQSTSKGSATPQAGQVIKLNEYVACKNDVDAHRAQLEEFRRLYNDITDIYFDYMQVEEYRINKADRPPEEKRLVAPDQKNQEHGYFSKHLQRYNLMGGIELTTQHELAERVRVGLLYRVASRSGSQGLTNNVCGDDRAAIERLTYEEWRKAASKFDRVDDKYNCWWRGARWLKVNWSRYRKCELGGKDAASLCAVQAAKIKRKEPMDIIGFLTEFEKWMEGDTVCKKAGSSSPENLKELGYENSLAHFFLEESLPFIESARKAWREERFLLQQFTADRISEDRKLSDYIDLAVRCEPTQKQCRLTVNECTQGTNGEGSSITPGGSPAPTLVERTALVHPAALISDVVSVMSEASGGKVGEPEATKINNFEAKLMEYKTATYAVTPKEQADAVESWAQNGRRFAALTTLLSSGSAFPAGLDAYMKSIEESTEAHVGRQINVLGFGSSAPEGSGATFGWLIKPRMGADGKLQMLQESMNAIVSIPSWWPKLTLKVRSCWESPDQDARRQPTSPNPIICDGANPPEMTITVPYSIGELRRKLGYEIERYPYVDSINGATEQDPQSADFFVGQRNATLLIEGGELWRSAAVTLGAQPADEIMVLPHMRGILATFRVIQYPSSLDPSPEATGARSRCRVALPIRVWTSEEATTDVRKGFVYLDRDDYLEGRCRISEEKQTQGPAPS